MIIDFHQSFTKQAKQLKPAQKRRLQAALLLFEAEPYHPKLRNHSLKGQWTGHRSISFGGDWRAHYIVKSEGYVFFVAVGTHSQLYK